jgi:hypothetical protein
MTMNTRTLLLIGLTLLAVALALFLPAVPQPIAHHDFAHKREAYGIENFVDVGSNLTFALAGGAGLMLVLRPRSCFASSAQRWPYLIFCIGVLLTAAGSCYYHLKPNNETLFWDRLPMTIAFMALISAQIVDRVDARAGLLALVPMLLIGVGTVVYWIITERQGRGNVMPYVVLQAYAVMVLLKLAAMHPSRYTHGAAIYAVFAGYLLAKDPPWQLHPVVVQEAPNLSRPDPRAIVVRRVHHDVVFFVNDHRGHRQESRPARLQPT